eukprot:471544_1
MFIVLLTLFSISTAQTPETTSASPSCVSCSNGYFDGCNTCTCGSTGIAACDQRFCSQDELTAAYCIDPPTTTITAVDCAACPHGYFDGCNNCQCGTTGIAACEQQFCDKAALTTPYCKDPPTTTTASLDCTSCPHGFWDGCNKCTCSNTGMAICTLKYCPPELLTDTYCYDTPVTTSNPIIGCSNCQSYYDGCNTCSCNDNGIAMCTLQYCEIDTYEEAICNQCKSGYIKQYDECVPIDCNSCKSYFDGCNECMCNEGALLAGCTKKYCADGGTDMKCNICVNGYELNEEETECVEISTTIQPDTTGVNCDICTSGTYFDGCNTCNCDDNGMTMCTEMACVTMGDPYCISHETVGCNTCPFGRFFDGCNECECNNGTAACAEENTCVDDNKQSRCMMNDNNGVNTLKTISVMLVVIGVILCAN